VRRSVTTRLLDVGDLQVRYHPLSFINSGSERAANAFGCAIDQGLTHEFYDAVFAAQGAESVPFTNDQLIDIGAGIGIDSPEFATCVNDGTYDGWAQNVDASQAEAGVTGTPTVFLNGELTDLPAYEPQALLDAVEAAKSGATAEPTESAEPTQ
jgi:protein-disulfide isomerase